MSLEERVASLALAAFDRLPQKCKPRTDPKTAVKEWIPMSAVVLAQNAGGGGNGERLHLASLATGSKCLPTDSLSRAAGLVLHDSHAEVLALRGLNRCLLEEVRHILSDAEYTSPFVYKTDLLDNERRQPFALRDNVSIHMFSTEAPCGDASMEIIMAAQDDATPWPVPDIPSPSPSTTSPSTSGALPGRKYFSELGIIRRKPARPDAPMTLSKSCTDKLSLKQFTSAFSALSSMIFLPTENTYISTLTIPFDKYNEAGYSRAFGHEGRIKQVLEIIPCKEGKYQFHGFKITPLPESFTCKTPYQYSKPPSHNPSTGPSVTPKSKASNLSAVYISTAHSPTPTLEILISGVKQGNHQFSTDERKGSVVCRKNMWKLVDEIVRLSGDVELQRRVVGASYGGLKEGNGGDRCNIKELVTTRIGGGGWGRNVGDDDWGLN